MLLVATAYFWQINDDDDDDLFTVAAPNKDDEQRRQNVNKRKGKLDNARLE